MSVVNPPFAAAALDPAHPLATGNRQAERASPIDALCNAAVDLLALKLPGSVKVEHFPNKPAEFDFEGSNAAALVIYDGSRFDQEGQPGQQGVRETVRLAVMLLVRSLRGDAGAYALTHEIRKALHGQSLAGMTGLRPLETELESESDGVFTYRLAYEGRLPAVPVRTATQHPIINRASA
jgi:Gp37 protein